MLSKKRPPVAPNAELSRIVQQIYTDLNEIIDAVNEGHTRGEKLNTEGKSGDIRVAQEGTDTFLEIKTDDGWVRSDNTSSSGFSFKTRT
tara:strand:+ start:225 stop:491 length:267 start_codon:yes stop_codon:yes gene_type:complete